MNLTPEYSGGTFYASPEQGITDLGTQFGWAKALEGDRTQHYGMGGEDLGISQNRSTWDTLKPIAKLAALAYGVGNFGPMLAGKTVGTATAVPTVGAELGTGAAWMEPGWATSAAGVPASASLSTLPATNVGSFAPVTGVDLATTAAPTATTGTIGSLLSSPNMGNLGVDLGKLGSFDLGGIGKFLSTDLGKLAGLKTLAGLYSAYQGRRAAADLREAAKTADPFGSQREQYQQLLSQSYTDPNYFMSTPEARLQQDALRQQLERMDAKAGRRSQYGSRAVQLAQAQAKALADYRAALQQPAGAGIGPASSASLLSDAIKTQLNAGGQLPQALSDIFTRTTPEYQTQAIRIKLLEDSMAKLTR